MLRLQLIFVQQVNVVGRVFLLVAPSDGEKSGWVVALERAAACKLYPHLASLPPSVMCYTPARWLCQASIPHPSTSSLSPVPKP